MGKVVVRYRVEDGKVKGASRANARVVAQGRALEGSGDSHAAPTVAHGDHPDPAAARRMRALRIIATKRNLRPEEKAELAQLEKQTYENNDEAAKQQVRRETQDALSGRTSATTEHAGESGGVEEDSIPAEKSLAALRRFARDHREIAAHFRRLGIIQKQVAYEEAKGGMAMRSDGQCQWSELGIAVRMLLSKPEYRQASLYTIAVEEIIHRCYDLSVTNGVTRAGVVWQNLPKPLRALVRKAYRSKTHYGSLGGEYLRMVVQVRNGFPLTEEFYRDTKALREALTRPPPPEVEELATRVSEMLLRGRDPHPKLDTQSADPEDILFD